MNERDFRLLLRAKKQIRRESAVRSFLLAGLIVAAVLRVLGFEITPFYPLLFVILFVSLVLNSDIIANVGMVSKKELVALIERQIHNDADTLSRFADIKNKT